MKKITLKELYEHSRLAISNKKHKHRQKKNVGRVALKRPALVVAASAE